MAARDPDRAGHRSRDGSLRHGNALHRVLRRQSARAPDGCVWDRPDFLRICVAVGAILAGAAGCEINLVEDYDGGPAGARARALAPELAGVTAGGSGPADL